MSWEEYMGKESNKRENLKSHGYKEWQIVKKKSGRMEKSEVHGYHLETKIYLIRLFILDIWNGLSPWKTSNQIY